MMLEMIMPSSAPAVAGAVPGFAKPQTFASEDDRARLSPAAIAGLKSLAAAWKLRGEEMAALLAVSPSTWDRMLAGTWKQSLNQDQLTRASALIGIFKGLHLLFADAMADRWPKLRNQGPLFANRAPVEVMIEEGIPMMLDVRRHVDALRGGL